jgi:hypothetical protein
MPVISTAAIARELISEGKKPATGRHHIMPCFTCGHDFDWNRTRSRFCSDRCRDYYDETRRRFQPYSAVDTLRRFPVSDKILGQGSNGAIIECRGCGTRFESVGLAYCSRDCTAAKDTARKPEMMPGKRRDSRHANAAAKQAEYRRRKAAAGTLCLASKNVTDKGQKIAINQWPAKPLF